MGRGDAEQRAACGVSGAAAVEAKDELVEIDLEVLATQAVIDAQGPDLEIGEDPVGPGQNDMGGHFGDDMGIVVDAGGAEISRPPIALRSGPSDTGARLRRGCERKRIGYIFGLAGNAVLLGRVGDLAEDAAMGRVSGEADKVRRYGDFRYAAKSWKVERRVVARVEAGPQGADSRFIVTNLRGLPRALYEKVYCARGQAENLIKAHKLHLASDRTSCTKATANQFRLLIHTAAYWLMLTLRGLSAPNIVLA